MNPAFWPHFRFACQRVRIVMAARQLYAKPNGH